MKYRSWVIILLTVFTVVSAESSTMVPDEEQSVIRESAVNGYELQLASCSVDFDPDLPLLKSNDTIESEINFILNKYMDEFLGTGKPSASDLETAVSKYNALNIVVSDSTITGIMVKNDYKSVAFLRTLVNHLRYNPDDTIIREKANNTVWLVTDQICKGMISTDGASSLYNFDNFARAAAIISRNFNETVQALFDHAMHAYQAFEHFWEPVYDFNYQAVNESINTDIMHNLGDAIMAFSANRPTADERYLWMRGYKRWVERFASFTAGTANGIKQDGTGFHHWTAYDNYMYAFKGASRVIYYLSETSFKINAENYLRFRDAVYAQIVYANDSRLKPLSMSGRKPNQRDSQYSQSTLKQLALAGGFILDLPTADTVLAAEYNRLFGPDPSFNYDTVASLSGTSGFFQFNYANLGIFRKDGWVAGMKGFTSGLWGSELYATTNRYGRYQSYGTLEIVYPGDEYYGNGFNVNTWNWNYNPGATTIVLPWDKLHGEYARIDEYQQKDFCGALAFKNRNSPALNGIHGTIGVFAMDFQEREGLGFSTNYGPNSHNKTFRWKKSTWVFEDLIIALGSDINNSSALGPTATTLFQRMDNNSQDILVNGTVQNQSVDLSGNDHNWVISNYSTGFYVVGGNDETVVWNGKQQVPYHNQINPSEYVNNMTANYWIGYINHGTNPVDAGYEYIAIPDATNETMAALDNLVKSGHKPYRIIQKNSDAHIIKHNSGIWGYAIFNQAVDYDFSGLVKGVTYPCLIMYEPNESLSGLKMAVAVPDLGIANRSYEPVRATTIHLTIEGEFSLADTSNSAIQEISYDNGRTDITLVCNHGLPVEFDLTGEVIISIGSDNQVIEDSDINIYPNPADDFTWIEGDFTLGSKWLLYNCLGSVISEGNLSSDKNEIDISSHAPGLYIVRVVNKSSTIYTGKLLVK